jgi:hypothetical protein
MTFWCGSGSGAAEPCLWLLDPDADPDPAFSSLTFKRQKKINLKKKFFCFFLFEGTFTSFFKDKKSKRSHKTVGIKVFLTIFAWWQKDPDPEPYLLLVDPDPDPRGPKTCGSGFGSGSGTPAVTILNRIYFWPSLPLTLSQRRLFAVILFACNKKFRVYDNICIDQDESSKPPPLKWHE